MGFWNDLKKPAKRLPERQRIWHKSPGFSWRRKSRSANWKSSMASWGKACYDAAVPGEDSPFSEFISAITQTLEEIEQSKEQQRLLKGGVRCASCGALMDAAALFCTNCGAENAESDGIVLGKLFLHGTIHDYELNCIKKEIRFAQSSSKLSGKLRFV